MRQPGVEATSIRFATASDARQFAVPATLVAFAGIAATWSGVWMVLGGPVLFLLWQFALYGAEMVGAGEPRL